MPPSNNEPVPITSLDPRQLQGLKERLESDLNLLGANNVQLQKAAGAFSSSNRAIETLAKSKEGQPVMLPLTGSLYVSGALASVDKVLVDIGTGYYVEMTTDQGGEYCKNKVAKLRQNIEACAQAMREKQSAVINVQQVLAQKVEAMRGAAAAPPQAAVTAAASS